MVTRINWLEEIGFTESDSACLEAKKMNIWLLAFIVVTIIGVEIALSFIPKR